MPLEDGMQIEYTMIVLRCCYLVRSIVLVTLAKIDQNISA